MGRTAQTVVTIFVILVPLIAAGCGSSRESDRGSAHGADLREYEATFHPSEFDRPVREFFPATAGSIQEDTLQVETLTSQQAPELTQGYRVQIFATSNFDDATSTKLNAETLFPDEWFYVVYDAPTYKIRAGNFTERYQADRFAKLLAEKGFKDAWVVPEKVVKDPLPRPADPPQQK
jgi:hypothetical protein